MENENRWLAALLTLGLLIRLAYGMKQPAISADGSIVNVDHYAQLATSLADHWTLSDSSGRPTAAREPGYPIFLGLIFKIFGSGYLPFLVIQSLVSVGSLWLLFLIGRQAFGPIVALVATAIGAVYPQFVFYCAMPVRETWMLFIDLLSLWLLLRAVRGNRWRDFVLAGLCAAAAALTATTFLPFGILVAPWIALSLLGKPWAFAGQRIGVYVVAFSLCYALWPLRNYAVLHRCILGATTASGDHFYMFMVVPEEIAGTPQHYAILAKDPIWRQGSEMPEDDRENFFWKAGLSKIRESPMAYARLVGWRFLWDEWRFAPRERDYGRSYRLIWWVSMLTDGWLIPLGFLGIALSRLKSAESQLALAFIVSISFTYALVLSMLRYRLVLMPWLILFAVAALKEAHRWLSKES